MTPKQEAFVREYLVDKNATQAAIRAGYSPRTAEAIGSENLRKPLIRTAVRRELDAQAKRTLITADKVLLDIQKFGDQALKAGEFPSAIRSRELLGKHYRLFVDRQELTGANGSPLVRNLSDEQLEARVKALQDKLNVDKG